MARHFSWALAALLLLRRARPRASALCGRHGAMARPSEPGGKGPPTRTSGSRHPSGGSTSRCAASWGSRTSNQPLSSSSGRRRFPNLREARERLDKLEEQLSQMIRDASDEAIRCRANRESRKYPVRGEQGPNADAVPDESRADARSACQAEGDARQVRSLASRHHPAIVAGSRHRSASRIYSHALTEGPLEGFVKNVLLTAVSGCDHRRWRAPPANAQSHRRTTPGPDPAHVRELLQQVQQQLQPVAPARRAAHRSSRPARASTCRCRTPCNARPTRTSTSPSLVSRRG